MQLQRENTLIKYRKKKVKGGVFFLKESFSKKAVGERLKGFRLSMHMTQKNLQKKCTGM